ncbi:hypothetical protein [Pseudodesulfovibrio sp.]|uniref:hypothetical protein n=1 Tax=unclassified Pseudodesulfovibrio TaxID=2661612 RepID=UPI003B007EA0
MEVLELCFNCLSLSAENQVSAFEQFCDAIEGARLLAVSCYGGKWCIYYNTDCPGEIELAVGYTIKDFYAELLKESPENADFFLELSDKAPYTEYFEEIQLYNASVFSYRVNGWHHDIALHRLALLWGMFLFGLPNNGWDGAGI